MKTCIKQWVLKLTMLGAIITFCGSCAALFAEIGLSCPSGSERSNYNIGDESVATNTTSRENASRSANNGRESKPFLSYRAGGRAVWPVADKVSVSSGLFLAGKGSKYEDSSFNIEEKTTLTYIDVPARVHYEFGETGLNINGGFQPSFLIGAKNTVTINGNETVTKGTDNFNTFDIAAGVGAGYTFANGILINLGYDHGLSNINKNDFGGFESKNRVLHLSLGYKFN